MVLLPFAPVFTPPEPWALGFAAPPRLPFVGDVDADGRADMIVVYPPGGSIIDVNLTSAEQKPSVGFQGLNPWGTDCQAATVGQFDAQRGTDVVGLFEGKRLFLAGSYANRHLQSTPDWVILPKALPDPVLATLEGGKRLLAFSRSRGEGFLVTSDTRKVDPVKLPRNLVWVGDPGTDLAAQTADGTLRWMSRDGFRLGKTIGKISRNSRPAATYGLLAFGDRCWTPSGTETLAKAELPVADSVLAAGDIDGDGDPDLLEFRYGTERHTANQVLLRRRVTPGETDNDHDGLSNEEEARLQTDPNRADTEDDGLLDGWEVRGIRGLDLPGLGCDPRQADLLCLISRFESVSEEKVKAEMARVTQFYAELNAPNPNGKTGFRFHPIYLDPVTGDDTRRGWPENRARFRPEKWRGIVHWMQITPGGGGQADELGDGGGCGEGALWAVFVHEFGHQLGLNHEGSWPNGSCPIYGSLMNYNYSYGFEDDRNKIHYSDGALAGYVLRETDLDETIPLPYDRVKFLEKGPYRFRLKPNGATTLIDWNWNGVFGEKHIRADINYAYSTNAGTRDDVGKSRTSPWLFVHQKRAFVLYGNGDAKTPTLDTTLNPQNPGQLLVRRLVKPFLWDAPVVLESAGLVGDPVAISLGSRVALFYPRSDGLVVRTVEMPRKGAPKLSPATVLDPDPSLVPSVGTALGHRFLMLWNPATQRTTIREIQTDGTLGAVQTLDVRSTNPPGLCEDTVRHEIVVALGQNQDAGRPQRWQIRRYALSPTGRWRAQGMEWVEGEAGQARGSGRLTVLFERSRDTGPEGRLYVYGRGLTDANSPWQCTYVAHQIADKTIRGGWLVKRYYDEWTQSRSAPAATWFGGDVLWSYRWVDGGGGPTDNNLHVGYRGLGLQEEPFGDHDDIGLIRRFGARNSLLYLGDN